MLASVKIFVWAIDEVYQIFMLIFHHWFLKVEGGHSFWNSFNCSGIGGVLEFLWKNGKILDILKNVLQFLRNVPKFLSLTKLQKHITSNNIREVSQN